METFAGMPSLLSLAEVSRDRNTSAQVNGRAKAGHSERAQPFLIRQLLTKAADFVILFLFFKSFFICNVTSLPLTGSGHLPSRGENYKE